MRTRKLALCVVGAALSALATGCLTLADDDGPVLSIELFWDARPDDADFRGSSCAEADVQWMEWTLYRIEGDKRVKIDSNSEPCADLLEVVEPKPGNYELDITGIDDDDQAKWSVTCGEPPDSYLTIVRFDVTYFCEIEAE